MVLLADRNFGAKDLTGDIAATGADVLVRLKNRRVMPTLTRCPDGSCLSVLGTLRARVIGCEITIATTAGRRTGVYRLATTLTGHHRCPAAELIRLYHQRWEIETAYLELKSSILGGRILRARSVGTSWPASCPPGGCACVPASSSAPSPNTRPAARSSIEPATTPPWPSTSSPTQT
jgi:hypothetical protein